MFSKVDLESSVSQRITALEKLRGGMLAPLELPLQAVLFVLCTAALVSQSYNPFIYFRF